MDDIHVSHEMFQRIDATGVSDTNPRVRCERREMRINATLPQQARFYRRDTTDSSMFGRCDA
jgi:hypothetical protein